jgi:hypothetical protein
MLKAKLELAASLDFDSRSFHYSWPYCIGHSAAERQSNSRIEEPLCLSVVH